MSINERIELIINQYFKGNASAFGREVGITQSTLKDIVGVKKNSPSAKTINKILSSKTLNINSEWLLTGKGDINKGIADNSKINLKKEEMTEKVSNIGGANAPIEDPRMEVIRLLERQLIELRKENRELIEELAILKYELKKKGLNDERNDKTNGE